MVENTKKNYLKFQIWGGIFFIILIVLGGIYYSMSSKLHSIIISEDIVFQICDDYIFAEEKSREIKFQEYVNKNDFKVLELKCSDLFPNKREPTIITQEFSHQFRVSENKTIKEKIDFPKNVLLDKSTMSIEFKVPKPNITFDVTFFGYSLGKVQNRDGTTRIGATHENIINETFTLEEIYYDDDTEFIVTNLMGNDIQVSYNIIYYIKKY